MPAAVAVPLIAAAVGGGASIAGAKMASGASKKAAKTQSDAAAQAMQHQYAIAQQALAAQQQARDQMYQMYQPQAQFGAQTLAALARGVGLPAGDISSAVRPGEYQGGGQMGAGGMAPPMMLPPPPGGPGPGAAAGPFGAGQQPWLQNGRPLSQVYGMGVRPAVPAGGRF